MPSVGAWSEFGNCLSQVAPESLTNSLAAVYRYFEALLESHDQLFNYKQAVVATNNVKIDQAEGIAETLGTSTGFMIYHMGRSLMFIRSMRRKQLKDQEFQHRLRTLPIPSAH